ncbi:hypothetical protein ACEWY4_022895 [Coilia grayii]|uniref:G-protein coupled receptors family 3 profile domain-containing protein n=1 Tax=Coilia grayii TaxID=363190 RepID=A0ABD1J1T3_9TELE
MQWGPNCSSECVSGLCSIHPTLSSRDGWDTLQRLCTLATERVVEVQGRSLSPVLCAVVWTLLSCGILLSLFFLAFTLRFKNNRIVKMSSPNLNVLTLCGSVMTYSSGFLFAIEEKTLMQGLGPRAVLQGRIWTLCIGTTLVFGPILAKTWRLYRVFTQRIPDKRVIIRDIQLMGLVLVLILVDLLVLGIWGLADPIRCTHSVGAVVKVAEVDVSYSLSQQDSCSSHYSDLWIILLSVLKGSLLLYGTYLAGLTSNVSLPPVNQSLTIVTAVCLVTMSSAVAIPVSRYLHAWPNAVYSVVSGAIFICTLAVNCLLFVPQLTQCRQFEEEMNPNPSQMSKYFSSPSRSLRSMYSEDEVYYLLGENTSMKRLLNEKNAVIDSLQEQVNNAKDKLLKLMSVSHSHVDGEMDSSNTNLNSCSTQTTVVQPDAPATPPLLPQREVLQGSGLPLISPPGPLPLPLPLPASPPPYVPPPPMPPCSDMGGSATSDHQRSSSCPMPPQPHPHSRPLSPPPPAPQADGAPHDSSHGNQRRAAAAPERLSLRRCSEDAQVKPAASLNTEVAIVEEALVTSPVTQPNHVHGSTRLSPQLSVTARPDSVRLPGDTIVSPPATGGVWQGFVSNEQLQEILQELSVDARAGTTIISPSSLLSPNGLTRRPSTNQVPDELSPLSPHSPVSPFYFHYPSISPYAMRKRRPPFYPHRSSPHNTVLTPPPRRCRGAGLQNLDETQGTPDLRNGPDVIVGNDEGNNEGEAEHGEEGRVADTSPHWGRRRRTRRRRSHHHGPPLSSRKCPIMPYSGHADKDASPSDLDGEGSRRNQDAEVGTNPYIGSDSDSDSSSEDYCYYHRPYCESCRQGSYASSSSDSTSDTSDSEYGGVYDLCHPLTHPVVNFNEDLKPTFV